MILRTSRDIYAHIDCNCFFVSCECLRRPELKGKYVVVGGDLIIAASYPCRKIGIGVGTPIWQAQSLLGDKLIQVRPDLAYYTQISRQFLAFLELHTLEVEVFSIDEAFVRITGIPELEHNGDIEEWAETMKKRILASIGIPVSIGVANTRIKAKIFSDINKPFWVFIGLDHEDENTLFYKLPVRDIPFIGAGLESRLGANIKTISDFIGLGYRKLERLIGKNATILWLELRWVDVWRGSIPSGKDQKSLIRSRSFNHAITDNKHTLWGRCIENFERAYREIILMRWSIRSVGVTLRTKEMIRDSYSYDFWEFTDDRWLILSALKECFEQIWRSGVLYRTTGVIFGGLHSTKPRQLSFGDIVLVDPVIPGKPLEYARNLECVLESLNVRYGKRTVRYGVTPEQKYQA